MEKSTVRCINIPHEEYLKIMEKLDLLSRVQLKNKEIMKLIKDKCKCDLFNVNTDAGVKAKVDNDSNEVEAEASSSFIKNNVNNNINIDTDIDENRNIHSILNNQIGRNRKDGINSAVINIDSILNQDENDQTKSALEKIDFETSFGKNQRRNAIQIAKAAQQELDWNDRGQLIIDGNILPKSNILHLIGFLLNYQRYRKEDIPDSIDVFMTKLRGSNLPATTIKNKILRQFFLNDKGSIKSVTRHARSTFGGEVGSGIGSNKQAHIKIKRKRLGGVAVKGRGRGQEREGEEGLRLNQKSKSPKFKLGYITAWKSIK